MIKTSMEDLGLSWKGVSKKWKWMTVDDDGGVWVYTDKPFQNEHYCTWNCKNDIKFFYIIKMTKDMDWKTLIWERKNNE